MTQIKILKNSVTPSRQYDLTYNIWKDTIIYPQKWEVKQLNN